MITRDGASDEEGFSKGKSRLLPPPLILCDITGKSNVFESMYVSRSVNLGKEGKTKLEVLKCGD